MTLLSGARDVAALASPFFVAYIGIHFLAFLRAGTIATPRVTPFPEGMLRRVHEEHSGSGEGEFWRTSPRDRMVMVSPSCNQLSISLALGMPPDRANLCLDPLMLVVVACWRASLDSWQARVAGRCHVQGV